MLGRQLWAAYLEEVFPMTERPEIDEVGLSEIGEAVWSIEARLRGFLEDGREVADTSIDTVDAALWRIARLGAVEAARQAPVDVLTALIERSRWALTLIAMEELGGGSLKTPLPVRASDEVRATAAFLAVLGHPDVIAAAAGRLRGPGH